MPGSREPPGGLDALLKPRSVAVVGASDDPQRVGGRPLHYMKAAGFAGALYPVNPKRREVQGLASYPSIADLPEAPDVAIVALPAKQVPGALADCADRGIAGAIVFSAGFAEAGAEGAELQAAVTDIAKRTGLRVLGPNCLGAYNADRGFFATFSGSLQDRFPQPGVVGMASQSGAYAAHVSMLAARRGVDFHYWITTGNESDIDLTESLAWLVEQPEIRVVVAYAEGVRDGPRLLDALARARALAKPVVFMKVGVSEVGAAAVESHTAALAGTDRVYDAALKQFGAYRARDTEEILDVIYACRAGVFPTDRRIGLMTVSGGVGIQMADAAESLGLEVAAMPAAAEAGLKARLPYAPVRNPVDVTGQVYNDPGLLNEAFEAMLGLADYPAIVAFFTMVAAVPSMLEPMLAAFADAKARHPDRVLVNCVIGDEALLRRYEAAGCLVFEDPTRAVRAVAALARFGETFAGAMTDEPDFGSDPSPPLPDGPIGEHAAKRILSEAGIPAVEERLARSYDEAVAAARELGWPVVLKIASPDILHKTEVGGVHLDLACEEDLRGAYDTLLASCRERCPDARLDGVLVSRQAPPGVETILGVQRDPVFGPVVMFGLGGILVEALGDVAFRVPPFGEAEARAMIEELRGAALLDSFRGRGAVDKPALVEALVALSRFAAAHRDAIETIDINPFLILPKGQGALALDALISPRVRPGRC